MPALSASAEADRFGFTPAPSLFETLFPALLGLGLTIAVLLAASRARHPSGLQQAPTLPYSDRPVLSSGYRHKIIAWLTSMLVLITFKAIGLTLVWFEVTSLAMLAGDPDHWLESTAGPLGEAFVAYASVFPAVLVWHFSDFLERGRSGNNFVAGLTSHRLLIWALALFSILDCLLDSGWFRHEGSCGGIFTIMSEACVWTSPAIFSPFVFLLVFLWLLALLKLAVMLWSRLRDLS